ncbi:tautomerase family protein [Glycomyces buryatensis]|uniref:Tautomerase pptA n=1 Tax=Glycomyces buryatensis TaxID=2570927 RepID=A0A4S8QLB5_9ACTN|nr:tautomerase family protein [Glycomyces buryatensis]THV42209.1 tautomerase pptA [Glycomyces buryatensis]
MPHVNIKHFPRDFTAEQRERLSEAVTTVVAKHLDTPRGAVSIALEPVPEAEWSDTVVVPEITGREHLLIKTPNYLGNPQENA